MAKNLYILTTEARSGKSVVCLGIMEILMRSIDNVGFFRPIINIGDSEKKIDHVDRDINFIKSFYNLDLEYSDMYAYTSQEANELIATGNQEKLIDGIMKKYKDVEKRYDFVLVEGTDFLGLASSYEFDLNIDIARNLDSPILPVIKAKKKDVPQVVLSAVMAVKAIEKKGGQILGTIVNRCAMNVIDDIHKRLGNRLHRDQLYYTIPEIASLELATMQEVVKRLDGEILLGHDQLHREISRFVVAAMQLPNVAPYFEKGTLIITPGDRTDILMGAVISILSRSNTNISGIVLTGGIKPDENVWKMIKHLTNFAIPVLSVKENTYDVALKLNSLRSELHIDDHRKISAALGTFETYVNTSFLCDKIIDIRSTRLTPKMFQHSMIQKSKVLKKRIVFPEGTEPRILQAVEILRNRDIVDVTLIGKVELINEKIEQLGLKIDTLEIVDPANSLHYKEYVKTYHSLRKHKGITLESAKDAVLDDTTFATMMVHMGHVDGLVSGSAHTTQDTLRPALQIIKTKPGFTLVSSVFFMCLDDKVLVYGDCAVNPNPTAEQLAEIAMCSAETARQFGIEPLVAMLSYSSGESGKGEDVDRVRQATDIVKKMKPQLKLEGPIQYDAAVDANVALTKLPNSKVAGKATVLIFPDLNTGNNTYKAVQRSAHALAIGPIMQGLNKPVNDLSRGCTVMDIVYTAVFTSIQAQMD